jgi:hypothetical protein
VDDIVSKSGKKKQLRDAGARPGIRGGQTTGQERGQQGAGTKPGAEGSATQGTQRKP